MKKYFYLLACLGALTLCTACGDDEPIDEPDKGNTETPNGGNNNENTTLPDNDNITLPDGVNNNTLEADLAAPGQHASFAGGGLLFRLGSHADDFVSVCGTTLDRETFKGELTIPAYITVKGETLKVTSIGERAFGYIPDDYGAPALGLTKVSLPATLTHIGEYAFYGCPLTSVTIGDSVEKIGGDAFGGCASLTSVTIGNSVKEIGYCAFDGCTSLTSVSIGNSVEKIGGGAFYGCSSLTVITIPESVRWIYTEAFWGCKKLTTVTCKAQTPPYCEDFMYNSSSSKKYSGGPFHGMYYERDDSNYYSNWELVEDYNPNTKNLRVPWKSLDEYKRAFDWSEFENIEGF